MNETDKTLGETPKLTLVEILRKHLIREGS
jgi:hypothetical protein